MIIRNVLVACAVLVLAACESSSTPTPQNQPPSIGAISDKQVVANGTDDSTTLVINDESVATVAVTVRSDNPELLPDNALSVLGSGAERQLAITPTVDQVGDAEVTVEVSDAAGLQVEQRFVVSVIAEQYSMHSFARDELAPEADGEPRLINAIEFSEDAEHDDFADLFE